MWPERSEGQRLETLARQSLGLYPQSKPPAMRVVMIAPPKMSHGALGGHLDSSSCGRGVVIHGKYNLHWL